MSVLEDTRNVGAVVMTPYNTKLKSMRWEDGQLVFTYQDQRPEVVRTWDTGPVLWSPPSGPKP